MFLIKAFITFLYPRRIYYI